MTADACWIIGPVTIDLFEGERRVPGGSVSYAARVAASASIGIAPCAIAPTTPRLWA